MPLRLRIALIRWSVRSIPGPVVVAERADVVDHVGDVGLGDLALEEHLLAVGEARLRPPTEVEDDLDQRRPFGQGVDGVDDLGGSEAKSALRSSINSRAAISRSHDGLPSGQRTPAGTRAGSATRTRVSFMSSVTVAIVFEPRSSSRLSTGDSYVRTARAPRGRGEAGCFRPVRDAPRQSDDVGDVRPRASDHLQIVWLVLLGYADLDEGVELGAVAAAARRLLDERLDVREAKDRGEARARHAPVAPWRSQSGSRIASSRWTGCGVADA